MESPIKAPTAIATSSWSGRMEAPRTVERKRKGRNVDSVTLPTPPRSRHQNMLPTPESIRRPGKPKSPDCGLTTAHGKTAARTTTVSLPTPETLPRAPVRKMPTSPAFSASDDDDALVHASPSGHTTFFLSSAIPTASLPEKINRRRPGLTFAQKMGLLNQPAQSQTVAQGSSAFGGRLGVGVGMGGGRGGQGHKVDQIVWGLGGALAEPLPLAMPSTSRSPRPDRGLNPFLDAEPSQSTNDHSSIGSSTGEGLQSGLRSPGRTTMHRPRTSIFPEGLDASVPQWAAPMMKDEKESMAMDISSPLGARRRASSSRMLASTPSPPAIRPMKKARCEAAAAMRDEAHNPFLDRSSSSSTTKPLAYTVPLGEKPTMTYVFRGAKKTFNNPFYNLPPRDSEIDLDIEDEEYELDPNPKPRLLWPTPSPMLTATATSGSGSGAKRRLFTQELADVEMGSEGRTSRLEVTPPPVGRGLFSP